MTAAEITARLVTINATLDKLYAEMARSLSIAGRSVVLRDIEEVEKSRRAYEAEFRNVTAGGIRPAVIRYVGAG